MNEEKSDEMWIKERLSKSVLLRHLFAKIGKEIEIETEGGQVTRGILKSLDLKEKMFELEAKGAPNNNTFFIHWKYIIYLSTQTWKPEIKNE